MQGYMLQVTGTLDWARAKQSVKHLMDMDGSLRQLKQAAEQVRDSIHSPAEASRPDSLPHDDQELHELRLVEILTFEHRLDHAAMTVKYAEERLQLLGLLASGKCHHQPGPALSLTIIPLCRMLHACIAWSCWGTGTTMPALDMHKAKASPCMLHAWQKPCM